ncbi:MAG: hypothetical protein M1820_003366 [Bogoriella megaspora]|nr:MAG: hypothetical protein M1820_003366 [Bogoriella megaspora]
MAEVLALAASILSVVQIADRVIKTCKDIVEAVRDAPDDLKLILLEISALKSILDLLSSLVKHEDGSKISRLLPGPIEGCQHCLVALEGLLPHSSEIDRPTKRRKITNALAWPLHEAKAKKLWNQLSKHKETLTLVISGGTGRDVSEIKSDVKRILSNALESKLQFVCDWLEHTNPTRNHNTACGLHEEHTGQWLARSTEWKNWLNETSDHRLLWVYGMPGAGKTILCSFAVEQIRDWVASKASSQYASVYYYCHYTHNQDESDPFLRWVVTQLIRETKSIPADAEQARTFRNEPSTRALLNWLENILDQFKTEVISLDAIDESQPRDGLLEVLYTLATEKRFEKLLILTMSRSYNDIHQSLESISDPISTYNPMVTQDIRLFVRQALGHSRQFRSWPEDLLQETEQALASGAKGMFRWAVCQIDRLQRLHSDSEIRAALKSLPKTLDETYERIFSDVPGEYQALMKSILIMICGHNIYGPDIEGGHEIGDCTSWDYWNGPIPVDALVTLAGSGSTRFFHNTETLKEVCGCLVHISRHVERRKGDRPADIEWDVISLAHYTVKEFLYSQLVVLTYVKNILTLSLLSLTSNARDFKHLETQDFYMATLNTLLEDEILWDDPGVTNQAIEFFGLAKSSQISLYGRSPIAGYDISSLSAPQFLDVWWPDQLNDDICTLGNILISGNSKLVKSFLNGREIMPMFETRFDLKCTFGGGGAWELKEATLLNVLVFYRYSRGSEYLASHFEIDEAVFTDWLCYICSGRIYNWENAPMPIHGADCNGFPDFWFISMILGAWPDAYGYCKTPLQIAVERRSCRAVKMLLDYCGSNCNALGTPDGILLEGISPQWSNASPLYICRHLEPSTNKAMQNAAQTIEAALLRHGAEEFEKQPD